MINFIYWLSNNRYVNTVKKPYGYLKSKSLILHEHLSKEDFSGVNDYERFLFWLGEVVGYGLLINFPVHFLLHWKINPLTVLSYGIVWYIIQRYRGK